MSFKRREYSGQFAIFDIDFVLNDFQSYNLFDAQKWFIVCLWCLAAEERNPNLGPGWTAFRPNVISRYTYVNLKVVKNSLPLFTQPGLTIISPSGKITVCSIKDKHSNLKWKNDSETDKIQFDVIETEIEIKKETERKRKTEAKVEPEPEPESKIEAEAKSETETESESAEPKSSCSDDDCGVDYNKKNKAYQSCRARCSINQSILSCGPFKFFAHSESGLLKYVS
jgi:hypothetical protein